MGAAFLERLIRVKQRREAIGRAILDAYALKENARVRRLEVARKVAETMGVRTVSPQFQVDVRQVALSLGVRAVKKANARFYRGLEKRPTDGQG
jgi:hypothetical protein